jgi:hypothetical protein
MATKPEFRIFKGENFIRGLHGVPNFPEYESTEPEDWYWAEFSKKEDNRFLWHDENETDSRKWRRF